MKIGILVPTRERPSLQFSLMASVITTVHDINNVNLYFGVDEDDKHIDIVEKATEAMPFVHMVKIKNDGKFIGINRIWNLLAKNSQDEIYCYAGDDFIWKTKYWDLAVK